MENNGTHTDECSLSATQQPVTWTTILWVLIAFSLNTMVQPAGTVCGGPPSLGLMLRSSPIICLIDAGYLLCRLAYYYYTSPTPRIAHIRLLRLRYQPWEHGAVDKIDKIQEVQKTQWIRLLVFVFNLVGMLRIYAFRGLHWSKAIASMYLASFVIVELFVVWPHAQIPGTVTQTGESNTEDRIESSGFFSLVYISVALAATFTLWFCASAVRDIIGEPQATLPKYVGLVIFGSWSLASLFLYAMCVMDRGSLRDILQPSLLLAPVLGIPWVYYTLGSRIAAAIDRPILVQAISASLVVGWVVVGLLYASAATSHIRFMAHNQSDIAKHRRYIEKVLAWYFMLLHLVTAILYLRFSYDPAGTSEPNWSKLLS